MRFALPPLPPCGNSVSCQDGNKIFRLCTAQCIPTSVNSCVVAHTTGCLLCQWAAGYSCYEEVQTVLCNSECKHTQTSAVHVFPHHTCTCVCLQWRGAQRFVWSALPPGGHVEAAEHRSGESEELLFSSSISLPHDAVKSRKAENKGPCDKMVLP